MGQFIQKGDHTWKLYYQYHRCSDCGYVFESRSDYTYQMGKYIKNLECPRCKAEFTEEKKGNIPIGPFFGEGDHIEMEWHDAS